MRVHERIRRSAVAIGPDRTLQDAAAIMERAGVGALAVVEDDQLVGMVTDRDLVRRGLARGLPADARIDGVMTSPAITIDADADLEQAFARFSTNAVRRLAVVRDGQFVGMVTVDDLLIDLARNLADLSRPVAAEVIFGHRDPPVPAVV